eukprot:scaffold95462_cov45-Attheya_sp.AAC.1
MEHEVGVLREREDGTTQGRARAMMAHQEKEKVNKDQRNKQRRQEKYRGRPDERKHIELIID